MSCGIASGEAVSQCQESVERKALAWVYSVIARRGAPTQSPA